MCRVVLICAAAFLPAASFGQSLFPGSTGSNSGQTSGGSRSNSNGGSGLFGGGGTTTGGLSQPSTPQTVNRSSSQNSSTNASTSTVGGDASDATGSAGSGGNTFGQGTSPGVGQMSGQTLLDQTAIGNNPFTGRSAEGGFIGVRATTQQANLNAFNQIFQGLQRNGNGSGRGAGQQAPERFQLRPTLRVGFDHSPITATASITSPRFEKRFTGITERRPQLAGVNITSDYEGRVVLRGSVANDDAKSLAAALLRLEPGVREVVNEITVEPPAAP